MSSSVLGSSSVGVHEAAASEPDSSSAQEATAAILTRRRRQSPGLGTGVSPHKVLASPHKVLSSRREGVIAENLEIICIYLFTQPGIHTGNDVFARVNRARGGGR